MRLLNNEYYDKGREDGKAFEKDKILRLIDEWRKNVNNCIGGLRISKEEFNEFVDKLKRKTEEEKK